MKAVNDEARVNRWKSQASEVIVTPTASRSPQAPEPCDRFGRGWERSGGLDLGGDRPELGPSDVEGGEVITVGGVGGGSYRVTTVFTSR